MTENATPEIPEDVIEKAAEALVRYSANSNSRWAGIPDHERVSARETVRLVAEVIWSASREQALAEVEQVIEDAEGFHRWVDDSRLVDEESLLEDLAKLRRKEGSDDDDNE